MNKNITLKSLFDLLEQVKLSDKARIRNRLLGIKKISDQNKQEKALQQIAKTIEQSIANKKLRLTHLPKISYPEGLPVSQNVDVIAKAITENQVVIIAGETGSGKTTQIPKICLQLGRGIDGIIGHTQPRRIAARTVANRISDELNTKLGDAVGYKVRFNDQVGEQSYIKLMTDGILLAEMQKDRLLRQYDTLIIDEAHERSLNIDFILGYLRQILPKRPDLKVIITSATIDPEKFAHHFASANGAPAPIIEVSGRTFPVEMRYRPLNELNEDSDSDADVTSGILNAVEELSSESRAGESDGDILVFLNGEREIRDTARALEKANLRHTNILPLYSRLTVAEQNLIFKPHSGRNIVLATNVAETSLTVPGIKYVIDPGTARISRYSYRTKVQRLPIEAISQASANQRAGRCGRVSSGVCIRLYAEDDFLNRPEFTDPEILRTNLATVILQMLALDLGEITDFPFVQAPDNRNINDGVKLLEELAAINANSARVKLTPMGRSLSKFPIDPRLAKMILTAADLGCIEQIFIIVSALSIQDPRERPHEKQQAADEKHGRFKNKQSDFISLLKLWDYAQQQQKLLTNNQFRRMCQKEFLSYVRIREWQDIYSQLTHSLRELKIPMSRIELDLSEEAEKNNSNANVDIVHQAILSGLLSHIGQQDENREYKGARGSKFFIFPGSALAKKSPKWLMAAELVETSRLFARMAAKIDPLWLEPLAPHIVKRNYSEPHWEKKQGAVMAFEQVSLYGLIIVAKRSINFNRIEPTTCREIFIREALVNGDSTLKESFLKENRKLVNEVELLEQKARRKDFLIEEQQLVDFYDEKLPETAICQRSFLAWWKKQKQSNAKLLNFTKAFLLKESAVKLSANEYPETWQQGSLTLPLSYHFSPGDVDDGISVIIPVGILNQVENTGFDWLIPALRLELITALIRSLPKALRRNFVPAPNYAEACLAAITNSGITLTAALEKQLLRMTGVRLPEDAWQGSELVPHLLMNFKVVNENGKLINQGRNLDLLKDGLQGKVQASIKKVADKGIERNDIAQWDFKNLPKSYEKKVANITIKAFPALVDKNKSVAIELFEHESLAEQAMLDGVSRLILLNIPSPLKYLQEKLPNKAKLGLYFNPFGSINELLDDCIVAGCQFLVNDYGELPRVETEFSACKEHVRAEIADCVLSAAIKVERVLSLAHDVRKKMKGKMSLNVVQSQGDIKNQLESIVFKGFITKAGYQRLDDIARYLTAMLRRLEKLQIDPNQDRLKMLEVEKVQKALDSIVAQQPKGQPLNKALQQGYWMIEELRVSLFAQNLKTPFPISAKRVLNYLKENA
ncbi:MAG: ATP-dependent RNA helicase HrpA [Colwellia polaris]|jgi:ATP-dependent helicase HrpA|uniref:ATP-dependent RNA helicase HrpA n=1 Tax=Colwellia polaris TaxID=326537 RepID=UPI000A1779CD|nr:ATP-dependent RNA helicase HrpA [Colwellia polaris]|tara:strand:- start:6713 stop:10672 length:3960 start_codon:yes stop_codon:yes gene_type:complete